jgi:hypothetical protein
MLQTTCTQFKELAATMRDKQSARNTLILRNPSDKDLRAIEQELIQTQRTIARHRRTCPGCVANAKRTRPLAITPSPVRPHSYPFNIAS